MTLDNPIKRRRRVSREAAEWLVTLRSESFGTDVRQQFVDWLRESPTHIAEMLRISQVEGALATFQHWADITPSDVSADTSVVQMRPDQSAHVSEGPSKRITGLRIFALAASLAAVAITLGFFVSRSAGKTIQTSVGERSEVTLADGSVVDVAPSTTLRVTLAERERLVVIDRGQAYFHVHKDPTRPFIAEASGAQIRAVGTAFNVDRREQGVVVTVTEGKVSVSTPAMRSTLGAASVDPHGAPVILGANQQLSISLSGNLSPVRRINGETEVAWTTGQLDFDNQTIEDVVRRFNAFNKVQIVVRDAQLNSRRVTGAFRLVDPESFVGFIQATIPGSTVLRDGNLIIIAADSTSVPAPDTP